MSLQEFLEQYLPNDFEGNLIRNHFIEDLYESYGWTDLEDYSWGELFESLSTQSPDVFKEILLRRFGSAIKSIKITDKGNLEIFFKEYFIKKAYLKNPEFLRYFDFFMYEKCEDLTDKNLLVCLPLQGKNVSHHVKYDCGGFIFHITKDEESKDKILKTGLRCKACTYRDVPERIYFFATEDYKDYNIVRKQLKEMLNELKFPNPEKCYVIKFNISLIGDKTKFYEDSAMECKHVYFTYNNIPAKCIVGAYKLTDFLQIDK